MRTEVLRLGMTSHLAWTSLTEIIGLGSRTGRTHLDMLLHLLPRRGIIGDCRLCILASHFVRISDSLFGFGMLTSSHL